MTNPATMSLGADDLAARTGGIWHGDTATRISGKITISSIEIDSRLCRENTLFVALEGAQSDGHDFISAAAAKGAGAAVVRRPEKGAAIAQLVVDNVVDALGALGKAGRAAHKAAGGRLVGITGSVGKTGSKEMLAHILRRMSVNPAGCHANRASFNNHLGVPLTLAALPAAPMIAVQEIGMNAVGEISALSALSIPDIAIITRIADSHAGFFNSLAEIAAAKAEIFDGMTTINKDGDGSKTTAILNRDDPFFDDLAARARKAGITQIISFGRASDADVRLINVMPTDADDPAPNQNGLNQSGPNQSGLHITAEIAGKPLRFVLGMRAVHWAENAMAVLAAVHALGLDPVQAGIELHDFNDLPGRGAVSHGVIDGVDVTVIDDSYNAGPASMQAAFASLAASPVQIMVLSDMLELGDGAPAAHAALAPMIGDLAPRLIITLGKQMLHMAGGLPVNCTHMNLQESNDVVAALRTNLRSGDTVFIKGSHGSGAWRIAAKLLEIMENTHPASGSSNSGSSNSGSTHAEEAPNAA